MPKICLTAIVLLLLSTQSFCQEKPADKAIDSLAVAIDTSINDSSLLRLDSLGKDKSYIQVGFGIGNNLFSVHNNIINAKETTPPIVYTPTLGYYHKSGFNITATAYLLTDKKKFGVNQYAVTPAYESAPGKDFDFMGSYTHYFVQNVYSQYASPIQNDFYASLIYKKHFLQPGIAFGYSFGNFKDNKYLDTTTAGGVKITYYDSTSNSLKSFSFIPSVQHEFTWYDVFGKGDEIVFTPSVMLNFGSDSTSVTDNITNVGAGIGNARLLARVKKIINKRLSKFQNDPFQLESFAASLDATYQVGNFSITPQIYLDYYIPKTSANSFSQVYLINFNYSF